MKDKGKGPPDEECGWVSEGASCPDIFMQYMTEFLYEVSKSISAAEDQQNTDTHRYYKGMRFAINNIMSVYSELSVVVDEDE